jgi:hypothetical protein
MQFSLIHPTYGTSILTVSSCLSLGFSNGILPSDIPAKIHTYFLSLSRVPHAFAHLVLLDPIFLAAQEVT